MFRNKRKAYVLDIIVISIIAFFIFQAFFYCEKTKNSKQLYNTSTVIDVSKDPEQNINYFCLMPILHFACKPMTITTAKNNYLIYPVAAYKISGVVVAKNTNLPDLTDFSPIDIGLVWGKMAEPSYNIFRFTSSGRQLTYTGWGKIPLSSDYIINHVSHNHIVPANKNILKAVNHFNINDKVYMEGSLINFYYGKNLTQKHNTSLTRNDIGGTFANGSCEILYVTKVRKGRYFYE